MIVIGALLLFSGCSNNGDVIAEIGDVKIEREQFADFLKTRFNTDDLSTVSFDDKIAVLHQLLDQHRKVLAAKELGLDQQEKYVSERRQNLNRFLATALYEKRITRALVPESQIREYYDWQQIRIEAVVIKVGHQNARVFKNDRSPTEAKDLAEQFKQQLAGSKKPQETAAMLTDDKRNKSHLNPYLLGRSAYDVDSAVFNAKAGDVVGPIETEFGYYLLRILSRNPEVSGESYESQRARIEKVLMAQRGRKEEKTLFKKVTSELMAAQKVQFGDSALAAFAAGLVEWGENPENTLEDFPAELRELELGRVGSFSYTGQEMLNYYGFGLKRDYKKFASASRMKELFLTQQFDLLAWAEAARDAGLESDAAVQMQLENFTRNRLSQLFEKEAINGTVQVTKAMIEKQYNEHPDRYTVGERIQAWKISVRDETVAQEIAKRAKNGEGFDNLGRSYEHQGSKKTTEFNLGYLTRKSKRTKIVEKAFDAGPNQIIGPFLIDEYYTTIKTGKYVGPILQPFNKVRATIRSELINAQKAERSKDVLEEIRIKYVHKINESILRSLT